MLEHMQGRLDQLWFAELYCFFLFFADWWCPLRRLSHAGRRGRITGLGSFELDSRMHMMPSEFFLPCSTLSEQKLFAGETHGDELLGRRRRARPYRVKSSALVRGWNILLHATINNGSACTVVHELRCPSSCPPIIPPVSVANGSRRVLPSARVISVLRQVA